MDSTFEKTADNAASLQRIWMNTMSRMMGAATTFPFNSSPPEAMRKVRSGMFQALAESWEEFMRTPQFLEGSRQCMDNAVAFRKLTSDFMARVRNEMQAPSRDDIDSIMLNVRHMEKRLLDRADGLSEQLTELNARLARLEHGTQSSRPGAKRKSPQKATKSKPGTTQTKGL